jgi:hypothetical protein
MTKTRMVFWPRYDNTNERLVKGVEYDVHKIEGRVYVYDENYYTKGVFDLSNFMTPQEFRNRKLSRILED